MYKAINTGTKESIGMFILFLDADDKFVSIFIEKCVDLLMQNNKLKEVFLKGIISG